MSLIDGIGRVRLSVQDIASVIPFYTEIIGLDVVTRADDRVLLGADGNGFLELVMSDIEDNNPASAGLYHTAIRVPDRASLGSVLQRVRDHEVFDGGADHAVSEAVYMTDPAGNGVEVYRDRPRSVWERDDKGMVTMRSNPLDQKGLLEEASMDTTVPPETDIGHVHLAVTDLSSVETFFTGCFGLDVQARYGSNAVFLGADGYHHHIGLNTWALRTESVAGPGLEWFSCIVRSEKDRATILDRCREAGVTVETDPVMVTGPDGFRIRLIHG